jgi:hypothetical protein
MALVHCHNYEAKNHTPAIANAITITPASTRYAVVWS